MPFRAFISADVDSTPKLAELKERLGGTGAQLKLVDLENIHLTLKFLGDTEMVEFKVVVNNTKNGKSQYSC